ncbi:MAG: cupin domain-containing protein [Pirellulaceae bacterium]
MKIVRGSTLAYEAASHEDPKNPGVLKKVLATQGELESGRVPMLNWSLLRVGKAFQRHYHENMQEVFVIIAGQVEVCVENGEKGIEEILTAGDAIIIDPGEIHSMRNSGTEDVTYLVFGIAGSEAGKTVVVD